MPRRTSIAAILILTCSTVWIGGPSGADTLRVKAAGSESEGWSWMPATRHAAAGDKVVWRNPTDKTHTVTSYGRGWSKNVEISPGERTRQTFRKTGTFKYRCTVTGHSSVSDGRCVGMCGKVRVH